MNRFPIPVVLVALCAFAYANGGSYTDQGRPGVVFPVRNDAIVMEKETIEIAVTKEDTFNYRLDYQCTSRFRNDTDTEQNVLMGFPHLQHVNTNPGTMTTEFRPAAISKIVIDVDGKTVTSEVGGYSEANSKMNMPAYNLVVLTEVKFKPNEKKEIRNSYSMKKYIDKTGYPMGGAPAMTHNSIEYILRAGKTWKEPIGESEIVISFIWFPDDFITVTGTIESFTRTDEKNRVRFTATNLVPSADVNLALAFCKTPIPAALDQIDRYMEKSEYKTVAMLFERLYEILPTEQDKRTKDLLRKKAFFLAGKMYTSDLRSAADLYLFSFCQAWSAHRPYWGRDYILTHDFNEKYGEWLHEPASEAPCYDIAYNLACAFSLMADLGKSSYWYRIALAMKPSLISQAAKDKDLAPLFEHEPELAPK
jgi:hypothetical protein